MSISNDILLFLTTKIGINHSLWALNPLRAIMFSSKKSRNNFWVSYTDLLTGLVAVFALLVVVLSSYIKLPINGVLAKQNNDFKVVNLEEAISPNNIGEYLSIRIGAIDTTEVVDIKGFQESMRKEFEDRFKNNPNIKISEDATIRLLTGDSENGVFSHGSPVINETGHHLLNEAIWGFLTVLQVRKKTLDSLNGIDQNRIHVVIKEIRIEGHASNDGDYLVNLGLSSTRSTAVSQYLLESPAFIEKPKAFKDFFKKHLMICGYSFSQTLDKTGTPTAISGSLEDKNQSRRVEFRVILESKTAVEDVQ